MTQAKPKTIQYKGFKIVPSKEEVGRFNLYTKEEWQTHGLTFATVEHDVGSIEEAKQFIDCWGE